MLRSNINNPTKSDFNKVKFPEHIEEVWKLIEKNIPIYFEKMIAEDDEFAKLKANTSFNVHSSIPDKRKQLSEIFGNGIEKYEKLSKKYHIFFSEESMNEFEDEDEPKDFKKKLSIEIPIIQKSLQSKFEAMKEWQQKFAWSKASDIYAIFFNLIDFMNEYVDQISPYDFGKINEISDLEKLVVLNEDDDYNVPGVVGMGIKSSVMFYLNPQYFLGANKNTLYGFYFLSDCEHFRLPSATSEFIMINDMKEESNRRHNINMLIDQNYWYPYDLFTLYSLRTYRELKKMCAKYKYNLDDEKRFIHVNSFMSGIWDLKFDVIKTMTGGDQDDAR